LRGSTIDAQKKTEQNPAKNPVMGAAKEISIICF